MDDKKEVVEKQTKKSTPRSFWDQYFQENFDIDEELRHKLAMFFQKEYGQAFEVSNQMDHNYQKDIITVVKQYSIEQARLSKNKSKDWDVFYQENINPFRNKSFMDIMKKEYKG